MTLRRLRSPALFALGAAFTIPLYLMLGGAPMFLAQLGAIGIGLVVFAFGYRPLALSTLDKWVLAYLGWAVFSFVINAPVLWYAESAQITATPLVSLLALLFTASAYLLGRHFPDWRSQRKFFLNGLLTMFAIVNIGLIVFLLRNAVDLFVARQSVAQRIPMMVTFFAWAICALAFWGLARSKALHVLWFGATVLVLLSLTRACYYQWLVSSVCFVYVRYRGRWNLRIAGRAAIIVLLIVAATIGSILMLKSQGWEQATVIVNRFSQLFELRAQLNQDESATVRIEIWRRLSGRVFDSPFHTIVGFGQLSPSPYLGGTFSSISGDLIDAYNAHSQYMDTLVRAGVVGVALELVVMWIVIWRPMRLRPIDLNARFFQAHSAALVGVMFYGIFHETLRWQMFGIYFWFYAGLVSQQLYARVPVAKPAVVVTEPSPALGATT